MDDRLLHALMQQRDGVLSLADAPALNMTRSALLAHARRRGWRRPHAKVLLPPGTALTYRRAVLVAVRAVSGGRVLVGGMTAAYLLGIVDRPPPEIVLMVSKNRNLPNLTDLRLTVDGDGRRRQLTVVVHQSRTLVRADATALDGFPLTTPARTIVDLAATTQVDDLRSLAIDARQRRILDLAVLEALHERMPRYAGRPRITRILRDLDENDCDSRLEWEFRVELRSRKFQPHPQPFPFRCRDGVVIEIDVAFPTQWVSVECDGWGSHADRASLVRDHLRQNRAVADGWRPFLVDWTRLKKEPDRLFGELEDLLREPVPWRAPAPLADEAPDPRFRGRRRRGPADNRRPD